MLPTPSTSHVDFNRIYEPAEDSFFFLDVLSSNAETQFLTRRFNEPTGDNGPSPTPLIVEVGTGSGIVLAFITAQAEAIFGRRDVVALGTDANVFACRAAKETVLQACKETNNPKHTAASPKLSATLCADLTSPLRSAVADVLIFNPPYVPSPDAPLIRPVDTANTGFSHADNAKSVSGSFEYDSHLLALSYAGGLNGMEVTNKLLEELSFVLNWERGVAYILLCQQNRPEDMIQRIRNWGEEWNVGIAGRLGKQGSWEKLVIVKIWRS